MANAVGAHPASPNAEELANYVAYTKARIPEVSSIKVVMCPDGGVDVNYTAHHEVWIA